jgi:hypothetical protein
MLLLETKLALRPFRGIGFLPTSLSPKGTQTLELGLD